MKSIASHINLVDKIKNHNQLAEHVRARICTCNSFLSADFIAHYGEITDSVIAIRDEECVYIGVGYLYDKDRKYNVFRIAMGNDYQLCTSIDEVISYLNNAFSFDLPNDYDVSKISVLSDVVERRLKTYDYGCYTSYIRELVSLCLPDPSMPYYNRKTDHGRRLEFTKFRIDRVPPALYALAERLSNRIKPRIHKNGYLVVEYKNEE